MAKSARDDDTQGTRQWDGLTVLSLVGNVHKPVKALWGVCHGLDAVVPRGIVINLDTPADITTRLLEAHKQGRFSVVKALLGVNHYLEADRLGRGKCQNDPSVKHTLPLLPEKLKELCFGTFFNSHVDFPEGHVFEVISFGYLYNQPVSIPPDTTEVRFDEDFNNQMSFREGLKTIVFKPNSRFSRPLIKLPTTLKRIVFAPSSYFDSRLELPEGVEVVELGRCFSQPLINLPRGLKVLRICDDDEIRGFSEFNHPVVLPNTLKEVHFGFAFNQPLQLPAGIERVYFATKSMFDQPLQLPVGVKELKLGHAFEQPLTLAPGLEVLEFWDWDDDNMELHRPSMFDCPLVLPDSIKEVRLARSFDQPLQFPKGIQRIVFTDDSLFDKPVKLPEGVKVLKLGYAFSQRLKLPFGLEVLEIQNGALTEESSSFNRPLKLPATMKEVRLYAERFNKSLGPLPAGLRHLRLQDAYNQPLIGLSACVELKQLQCGGAFNQQIELPRSSNLRYLSLFGDFNQPLVNLSACVGLESLTLGEAFKQPLELPPGLVPSSYSSPSYQSWSREK